VFHQLLTPIASSLPLSFLVAALPIATVLIILGVLRKAAWLASLAGLLVGLAVAVGVWQLPLGLADSMRSATGSSRTCPTTGASCWW